MDIEKIKTDFEKRYKRPPEGIYFAGKNIDFFKKDEFSISACLTVGESLAFAKRQDEKVTIQFSGRDDLLSFSLLEIDENSKEPLKKLLFRAASVGIKSDGADIFLYKNTAITNLFEPLIIGGFSGFCKNVPPKERLIPLFENFKENMKTLSGRKGCFLVFDGQKPSYKSFFGGKVKVVLIFLKGGKALKNLPETPSLNEGLLAIKKGDMEAFGMALNNDSQHFLKTQKEGKAHKLFASAMWTKDAIGCGILEDGNLFSLVENEKIDRFIQGTDSFFRKNFGGSLDFYVTDFADSGIFIG